MKDIDVDKMRLTLDYDPETGIFKRKIPCSGRNGKIGDVCGVVCSEGYVKISFDGVRYYAHRLALAYVNGVMPPDQADHINGIRNDNRISNLREATGSQNGMNKPVQKNNTSGFKGVSWNKDRGKWAASVNINKRKIHLGLFDSLESAANAAASARISMHGEFSKI